MSLFFIHSGLLPPQIPGQSTGRATVYRFLKNVCEQIPWATHSVSGKGVVGLFQDHFFTKR